MTGINPLEFQKAKQARLRQQDQQTAASAAGDTCYRQSHSHAVLTAVERLVTIIAAICLVQHKEVFCHVQLDVLTVWLQVLHAIVADPTPKVARVCDCGKCGSLGLQYTHVTFPICRAWH